MAVVDTTPGFHFVERECKQPPTLITIKFKDTETLQKYDLVIASSGEADLGATGSVLFLGAVNSPKQAGVDSTTDVEVICDVDAIYSVYDPVARSMGAMLDISGATGAMTVATDSNHDLIVVRNSTADELTLVKINPASHAFHS